jgi:hypothetical protein
MTVGLGEIAGGSQGHIDKREGWRVNAEGVVAAVVQIHRICNRWAHDRPGRWEQQRAAAELGRRPAPDPASRKARAE